MASKARISIKQPLIANANGKKSGNSATLQLPAKTQNGVRASHGPFVVHAWLSIVSTSTSRERYLTAATYTSSRAFPSSLLSSTPTLTATEKTKPVLLPGVDSLNHKRAQPVSWSVNFPTGSDDPPIPGSAARQPSISLILHTDTAAGNEIFNNYGPKPNAELILGYGFSLSNNPDDTILLKIGGIDKRWEIGREARGVDALWGELLLVMEQDQHEEEQEAYETQMDAADMLASMAQVLLEKLPTENTIKSKNLRPEVAEMWKDYIEGDALIFFHCQSVMAGLTKI